MSKPKFTDNPKSISEQVNLLASRRLDINRDTQHKLSHTNYYRLSPFWKHRLMSPKLFKENTDFDSIWNDYRNDRQLRLLIMDAVERIEVSFKTKLANTISIKTNSPFPQLDTSILAEGYPTIKPEGKYKTFLDKAKEETKRSTETFVKDFFNAYDETILPIWILVEILSFGTVSKYFEIFNTKVKKEIAKEYNLEKFVFEKWIHFLSIIRNMCCHHSRFWRKSLTWQPPKLKRNIYNWNPHTNFAKVFGIISILKYFMNIICPASRWHNDLYDFLDTIDNLNTLGFPQDWKDYKPFLELQPERLLTDEQQGVIWDKALD
ncbi:MAG: Abi family protein [Opitutales bacterium]